MKKKIAAWTLNGGKPRKNSPKGSGKGVDGVDRTKLDDKALDKRLRDELKEVWDE
jgi:hypothetical protein